MKDTVNNDDILWCSDIDRERKETYRSQVPHGGQASVGKASIIQPPHPTMQAAGIPGASDAHKLSRVSPFSAKKISVTSGGGDHSGVTPQSARRPGMASIVISNTRGSGADKSGTDQDMQHVTPPLSPTSHMGGADLVHKIIASPRAEINTTARISSIRDYTKYRKSKKSQITKVSIETGR